jgi:hypothetical protein
VDDAAQEFGGLCHFTAHTVGMCHNSEFGDGVRGAPFLHEQVAHEGVKRQVGGRVLDGVVGFVHGGAQTAHASQLIDAVHGFKHRAGLGLQDHICKRGGEVAILLGHLFAGFVELIAPVGAHQQPWIFTDFALGGFVILVLEGFDQRFVLLTDVVGDVGGAVMMSACLSASRYSSADSLKKDFFSFSCPSRRRVPSA